MVTNSVVLQLAITLMVTLTTTFGGSGKAFRLKTISQRSRSNSLPHYMAVLDRLDQLTSLVRDLQTAVDDMHDTVKMINDSVNPSVVQPCTVELQSVGYWETESAFIKLNGHYALKLKSPEDDNDAHNPSGTYTVLLDKAKCRIKELKYFDTHFSSKEAGKLAMYLNYVPYGQHVIVLTVGDAFSNMSDVAFNALSEVGIDIKDVVDRGQTFTAIIVLGSHCRTMYELHEHDLAHLDVCLKGDTDRNSYFTYKGCKSQPCECPELENKKK